MTKRQFYRPITLKDVPDWFLEKVVARFWPQHKKKALIILGEPGRGKTPLAEVIGLAVAEYWAAEMDIDEQSDEQPCIRVTQDFDFVRGGVGSKCCVDILYDTDMDTLPIKKAKAVTDLGNVEVMTKERWTGVKWLMNQL